MILAYANIWQTRLDGQIHSKQSPICGLFIVYIPKQTNLDIMYTKP